MKTVIDKLLNCLVGNGEDAWPQCKAERFRGLEVDHELELRRLQNRQIRRLLTFKLWSSAMSIR